MGLRRMILKIGLTIEFHSAIASRTKQLQKTRDPGLISRSLSQQTSVKHQTLKTLNAAIGP